MDMFKLLATFRVAYETRNFSKAAEVLFISQPAVSNQIKQLEEELQCVLFKRKGKHFSLFEAFCLLWLSRGWS